MLSDCQYCESELPYVPINLNFPVTWIQKQRMVTPLKKRNETLKKSPYENTEVDSILQVLRNQQPGHITKFKEPRQAHLVFYTIMNLYIDQL